MLPRREQKIFIQFNRDTDLYQRLVDDDNFAYVSETFLLIKNKNKEIVPFVLNDAQKDFLKKETGRDIILKARQLGFTTLRVLRDFWRTIMIPNTNAEIIAHTLDDTIEIFRIITLAYELLPPWVKLPTKYQNKRELYFEDINSKISVSTAGKRSGLARGSTKNHVHCSEVAFWPDGGASLPGLMETLPKEGSICFESTSNGPGDFFHEQCVQAKEHQTVFVLHFYSWWWEPQYREEIDSVVGERFATFDENGNFIFTEEEKKLVEEHDLSIEQILWRRNKISILKEDFQREYPETFEQAFLPKGKTIFNRESLEIYHEKSKTFIFPPKPGKYANIPEITLFRPYDEKNQYLLSIDPADNVGRDFSVAYIMHKYPLIGISAKIRSNTMDINTFAKWAYELAEEYDRPLGVIERNKGGAILNYFLKGFVYNMGQKDEKTFEPYGELYYDTAKKAGIHMTNYLKTTIIQMLKDGISEMLFDINDETLVSELYTFMSLRDINSPLGVKTVYGAASGFNDDCVMAFGIGVFVFNTKFTELQVMF